MTTEPPLTVGMSAVEWAREHGAELRWLCQLDNYDPPREAAYGSLFRYTDRRSDAVGETRYILVIDEEYREQMKRVHDAVFLIDNGLSVQPHYVIGYRPAPEPHIMLGHFPTDIDEAGNQRRRADDGRPVDFFTWRLGPRVCYHLKVREP